MQSTQILSGNKKFLSETDSDTPDESLAIDHRSMPVVTVGHPVTEMSILGDQDGIGPHFGSLFAKLVLDKITVHPGLGPYPNVAQFDVTSFGPALDQHHLIGMGLSEMRPAGIKPGADIRTA